MKKIVLLSGFFCSVMLFSQVLDPNSEKEPSKKQEISMNLLDLVVAGNLELQYERLLKGNQSLEGSVTFFDQYGYTDVGYIESTSAFSFRVAYLIYFSKSKDHHGFFFYPFARYRTGSVTTEDGYYDYNNGTTTYSDKYKVDGLSAGFGLGHKWLFNDKITLDLGFELGRDLTNTIDTFYVDELEPRFKVGFGFRF